MFKRKYIHIIATLLMLFNLTAVGCTSNNKTNSSAKTETTEQSKEKTIKGNINSKGEKIYHMPNGQFYDVTKPEEWFATEEEAQAAGYRKSKK